MHNDDDYMPFNNKDEYNLYEIAIRYVEVLILIGSMIASILHYFQAGKKLSDVTRFHVAHTLFCCYFFLSKAIPMYSNFEMRICRLNSIHAIYVYPLIYIQKKESI